MFQFIQHWGSVAVGLLAATFIVVGAHLALRSETTSGQSRLMTRVFAFGTGAFFTAVCLDFLPDAWSGNSTQAPFWIFLGALVLWTATHFSDVWFAGEQEHQRIAATSESACDGMQEAHTWQGNQLLRFTPVSAVVLAAALSFHTFLEGAAVSLAFRHLNWNTLGFSLAIILHKLPEGVLWGLALATVFPRDRLKIRRILFIPAICTLLGVFLGIFLANQASAPVINGATGFVAGAMFYIAFAELLPALRESTTPRMTRNWFLTGVVIMFILNSLSIIFTG